MSYTQRQRAAKERAARRDPNSKTKNRTFEAVLLGERVRIRFAAGGPEKNCFKIAGADYYVGLTARKIGKAWSEFTWGSITAAKVQHIFEVFPD